MLHHLAKFAHARKPAYARPPFCGGSNPCPRVRIHIIKHNKKSRPLGVFYFLAVQEIFYLWLMKNLHPRHKRNGQKQGKTGNFCKKRYFWANFTQPTIEHARRFSGFLPCPAQKFPTKITGNFLEHIRELSANNRELYFSHLRESVCYLYAICLQMPHRVKRLKLRHDTDSKHLLKSVCFLYPSY